MDYNRFLNPLSLRRQAEPIRSAMNLLHKGPKTMISMAGGHPNVDTFPYISAVFKLRDGTEMTIDETKMKQALQYCPNEGMPLLLDWIRGLQDRIHQPHTLSDGVKHRIIITNGSSDGIAKVFDALISPGEKVLLEHPCFSGTLAAVKPMDCTAIPVNSDSSGLNPEHLREVMSRWSPSDADDNTSDIPKLVYTVPNGGNPTGHGLKLERKKAIYKIAQTYNLMILEDDPYYYLQFTQPRVPSFLSLDTDGRVIRFDSFSKILSSGMRVGFMTAPKQIADRILFHIQASLMHPSGLSQMVLGTTLQQWGYDGFLSHTDDVTEFYRKRRDCCIKAAEKHLNGLAEWTEPSGGMFLWLKLNVSDTFKLISTKAVEKGVVFIPGNAFALDADKPSRYIRAAYSVCSEEQMDLAFERLAALIRQEQTTNDDV